VRLPDEPQTALIYDVACYYQDVVTYDKGSKLRYRVEKSLAECGIRLSRTTGTWESSAVSAQEAAKRFQEVFAVRSGLKENWRHGRGRLNHLWI
jgi:hypothetical protein